MKNSRSISLFVVSLGLLGLAAACSQPVQAPPSKPDLGAIETTIRNLDKVWSDAATAKDLDKTVSFYADDANFLMAGLPLATGKDNVRKAWSALLSGPSLVSLSFAPTSVHVNEDGDMAYEIGTYELVTKDQKGKQSIEKGKFAVVWKKQADGSWKVEVDSASTPA